MQMGHGFTALSSVVDHQAETRVGHTLAAGELTGDDEQVAEQRRIIRRGKTDARERLAGHNEQMHGCLR